MSRSREDDFERIAREEAMAEQRKLMEASRSNQARPSGPEIIALDDSDDEDRQRQREFRGSNFGPNRGPNFGPTREPNFGPNIGGRVPPQPPRLSQPSWGQPQQPGNQWRY
jgi:hypothetical protein